jgi:hypothetical protein
LQFSGWHEEMMLAHGEYEVAGSSPVTHQAAFRKFVIPSK